MRPSTKFWNWVGNTFGILFLVALGLLCIGGVIVYWDIIKIVFCVMGAFFLVVYLFFAISDMEEYPEDVDTIVDKKYNIFWIFNKWLDRNYKN